MKAPPRFGSKTSNRRFSNRLSPSKRGYNSRWNKARKAYLAVNPLCKRCSESERVTSATIVDHIIPHKGDQELFWDRSNWQGLCKQCHDRKTATEDGGFGRHGNKDIYKPEK